MSETCQLRTSPLHSITSSARPSSVSRDVYAECLASLQVDRQFELGRKLDRQIGRFGALEDAIDIGRRPPIEIGVIDTVGNQAARDDHVTIGIDRRHMVTRGKRSDQNEIGYHCCKDVRRQNEAGVLPAAEALENALDVGSSMDGSGNRLDPVGARGCVERLLVKRNIGRSVRVKQERGAGETAWPRWQ